MATNSNDIVYMCIYAKNYKEQIAFSYLLKLKSEFNRAMDPQEVKTKFLPILKE